MKVMFIHRWTLAFRFCFALLFLCCAAPLKCATQSASSVKADAASRASATYQHGMSALQKGDLVSARADFEKVVRLAPNSPEGHNSLGWVLLAQGEIDSAIVHFRAAVKLNPDFALAHMNFSSALSRKGDVAAALREAKEAVRLARDDSETHHILARTLDFSGDLDGAIGEFRRAIELEPKGRNCMTISVPCWCRSRTRKAQPPNFPKRCGCSLISPKRIFISAFCVTRKDPSKKPRSTFKQQCN